MPLFLCMIVMRNSHYYVVVLKIMGRSQGNGGLEYLAKNDKIPDKTTSFFFSI